MRNWSTDVAALKKDKERYAIWRMEQLINYGLDGEKLDRAAVKKYWNKLQLDPETRRFLRLLLWKSSRKSK